MIDVTYISITSKSDKEANRESAKKKTAVPTMATWGWLKLVPKDFHFKMTKKLTHLYHDINKKIKTLKWSKMIVRVTMTMSQ